MELTTGLRGARLASQDQRSRRSKLQPLHIAEARRVRKSRLPSAWVFRADAGSDPVCRGLGVPMPGYVYVWQQAMLRNAKRREGFEPPVIVRARGEVYGVRITGGSEIVYTPPDRFKT